MTASEKTAWIKAAQMARIAMGKTRSARNRPSVWIADDDPLAWWLLTETLYFGTRL